MHGVEDIYKGAFAVVMSIITYLFGGIDQLVVALVAVIALDYVTGFLAAAHNNRLNSEVGAKGIIRKVTCLLIVALSNILDNVVGTDSLLRDASIYFFIANEGLSILENAAGMGFPLPKVLTDKLEQLRGLTQFAR